MSTFSRAQNDYLSPPESADPHPWSEDLQAILEDAGVAEEQVNHAVGMFDAALQLDPVKLITHDDLFSIASMCSEFDSTSATFWKNSIGETVGMSGSSFEDTLTKVFNEFSNQDLTDEAEAISDYLFDVVKLKDDAFEAAHEVLERLRYHYILAGKVPEEGEDGPAVDTGKDEQPQVEWDGAKRTMREHLFLMTGERDRYRALYEQALPKLTRMERRITELMGESGPGGQATEATQGDAGANSPKAPKPRG